MIRGLFCADVFEDKVVRQSREEDRSIESTLDLLWELIAVLPEEALTRLDRKYIEKYHPAHQAKQAAAPAAR